MRKPDWKDAPEWAMWMAQDGKEDGSSWTWFQVKPERQCGEAWIQVSHTKWCTASTSLPNYVHWSETLEPRP